MSLRSKIVLILVAVVVLYAGVDNLSLRLFTKPVYETWEVERAAKELAVIDDQIADEFGDLQGKARLYAGLEDVVGFLRDGDRAFAAGNLDAAALDQAEIDLLFFCDRGGQVLWGEILEPQTREPFSLKEMPRDGLRSTRAVMNFFAGEDYVTGLMVTERGPLLVASAAVGGLDPKPAGRFRAAALGTVILGRFLDDDLRRQIEGTKATNLRIHEVGSAPAGPDGGVIVDDLTTGLKEVVSRIGADGRLHLYRQVPDLRTGEPLILEASLEREVFHRYQQGVNYALVSTLAGACLFLLVLLVLLRHIVIHPLSELTKKAVEIGQSDDTTIRVDMVRDDEIGQLAGEFDSMLEDLALSRAQVVKSARLAGMSEVATGVLHNVGNVLNSVNVSAKLVSRNAEKLSAEDLEQMVDILRPHADDLGRFMSEDPRGKHFLPLLLQVTDSLVVTKRELLEEVGQLGQGIEHIAELVRSQQSITVSKGVLEQTSLETEIEGVLRILEPTLDTAKLAVEREFESLPNLSIDRHRLMEILVNLIKNAQQAIDEHGAEDKRITLRLRQTNDKARIEVADNGIGIEKKYLTRVFQNGYTTKQSGQGFGLHISANAAVEMGGSLTAESKGVGQGATFILELPLDKQQESAHAA